MLRHLTLNVLLAFTGVAVFLVVAEFLVPHVVTLRDVGASFTEYDSVVGKRLKTNFSVVRTGPEFTMAFSTNSLGVRGEEPQFPPERPLIFLGDSFTMGYGVSNGEEFPAVIQAALRQRMGAQAPMSLNLGVGNSGNGFWIRHLDHTAPRYNPRLVVMEVLQNDFKDNLDEHLYELDKDGQLVEFPIPAPSWPRQLQQFGERIPLVANSNLLALARQAIVTTAGAGFAGSQRTIDPETAVISDENTMAPGDPLTLQIVETAIRRCQAKGWPVLVLSVGLTEARRQAIASRVKATGAPLLELPSKKDRPDLFFRVDGHWNVNGHREAARQLLARIDELKLLDSR